MPVALWGSEFWGGEEKLCERMESTLASGLRMVSGAPPRASRVAIGWELGYAPVFLRAAVRRLRILNKLRSIDLKKTPSGFWARQAILVKVDRHWGWVRRTIHLAELQLKTAASSNTLPVNRRSAPIDYKSLLHSASLAWYRRWATKAEEVESRALLAEIHSSDKCLAPAEYLQLRGVLSRILLMCRTGSLMLNYRVNSFSPKRSDNCMTCATPTSTEVETLEHFVLKCPGLEFERHGHWMAGWGRLDAIPRMPDSMSAALGESSHFFDNREPAERRELQRVRLLSLGTMWRIRSARLTEQLGDTAASANATPGVEAN